METEVIRWKTIHRFLYRGVEMSDRSIKSLTLDLIFFQTVIIQLDRKLLKSRCCGSINTYSKTKMIKVNKMYLKVVRLKLYLSVILDQG